MDLSLIKESVMRPKEMKRMWKWTKSRMWAQTWRDFLQEKNKWAFDSTSFEHKGQGNPCSKKQFCQSKQPIPFSKPQNGRHLRGDCWVPYNRTPTNSRLNTSNVFIDFANKQLFIGAPRLNPLFGFFRT